MFHHNKKFNDYEIILDPAGAYVLVELTRGQWCQVDLEDWLGDIGNRKWHSRWDHHTRGYYAGSISLRNEGPQKSLSMSRLILGVKSAEILVDHMDRNTLNNRRSNLRLASRSANARNKNRQTNNTSGFIGVSWFKSVNKWGVVLRDPVSKKQKYGGVFSDVIEAARVRDRYSVECYGEFAALNFPHLLPEYQKEIANAR